MFRWFKKEKKKMVLCGFNHKYLMLQAGLNALEIYYVTLRNQVGIRKDFTPDQLALIVDVYEKLRDMYNKDISFTLGLKK